MKLLHIDSSVLGPHSVSRQLSAAIVARLRAATPGLEMTYRDLTTTPLSHLSGPHLAAAQGAEAPAELQGDLALSHAVLDEFLAADIVVLGAPMYNFTIPSQLKAWIDRILVAGKTFKYGAQGAEGLAGNKRVIVGVSRGGFYAGRRRRTSRNLSALGFRLHRHRQSRIHFRRWYPDRTGAAGKVGRDGLAGRRQRACGIAAIRHEPPSTRATAV